MICKAVVQLLQKEMHHMKLLPILIIIKVLRKIISEMAKPHTAAILM